MSGKQTAVDFLTDWVKNSIKISTHQQWLDIKDQALIMEREQIEDAYCNGVIDGAGEILNRDTIKPDALKYYEDNHGKEAQP